METYRHKLRLGVLTAIIVIASIAAGCGGTGSDTADSSTTTTTAATTTYAPSTTTTTEAATTTTEAATTTTEAATTTTSEATTTTAATTTTIDVNTLAEGSGCTPGTDELGSGIWFGYVDSANETTIEFDLACWFTGDAAAQAAAEDGEESPPPNDYYVRNVNPQLRTITMASTAEVSWMPNPGDPSTQTVVPYADWLTGRETRGYQPGVWVTIEGGEATFIEEQYVP